MLFISPRNKYVKCLRLRCAFVGIVSPFFHTWCGACAHSTHVVLPHTLNTKQFSETSKHASINFTHFAHLNTPTTKVHGSRSRKFPTHKLSHTHTCAGTHMLTHARLVTSEHAVQNPRIYQFRLNCSQTMHFSCRLPQ